MHGVIAVVLQHSMGALLVVAIEVKAWVLQHNMVCLPVVAMQLTREYEEQYGLSNSTQCCADGRWGVRQAWKW